MSEPIITTDELKASRQVWKRMYEDQAFKCPIKSVGVGQTVIVQYKDENTPDSEAIYLPMLVARKTTRGARMVSFAYLEAGDAYIVNLKNNEMVVVLTTEG